MASSNDSVQKKTMEKSALRITTTKIPSSNFFYTGLPSSGLPAFMVSAKISSSYIVEEKTLSEKASHGLLTTQTSPAIFQQFEKRPQASEEPGPPTLKK